GAGSSTCARRPAGGARAGPGRRPGGPARAPAPALCPPRDPGGPLPRLAVAGRRPPPLARPAGQQARPAGGAGARPLLLPDGGARHSVRPVLRLLAGDALGGREPPRSLSTRRVRAAHPPRHGLPLRSLRGPRARPADPRGAALSS